MKIIAWIILICSAMYLIDGYLSQPKKVNVSNVNEFMEEISSQDHFIIDRWSKKALVITGTIRLPPGDIIVPNNIYIDMQGGESIVGSGRDETLIINN